MKQLIFFVLLAMSVNSVKAQTLRGMVIDTDSLPVKGVSVLLLDGSGRTIRYTKTAANGQFSLSTQGLPELAGIGQGTLIFTHVGYAKDTISTDNYVKHPIIMLSRQAVAIREVKVRAPRINEQGDTLDYIVDRFCQKQDRSLSDVLKKMPGIEVKADGSICYQGTPINTFYIEGMDLMGSHYTMASENLQADKVKKVQVLQHHQPLKALRDIEFSQQAALNIVLKDDAKDVWQGIVDLSMGTSIPKRASLLADGRFVGMLFAKHRQSVSMYKTNNTGKDIIREVDPSKILDRSIQTDASPVGNIQSVTPSLKEERYRDNHSHLVATNWLFKPTPDSDIRLQFSGLYDKTGHKQQRETIYAEVGSSTVVNEISDASTYRRELTGELTYKLNNNNIYLSNALEGYTDFNSGSGEAVVNGHAVRQQVKPHYRYLTDKLSIIKKLSGHHTISARAYFTYQSQPSMLLLSDSTIQYLQINSLVWGADTGYGYTVGPLTLNCSLNIKGKSQHLHVSHEQTEECTHYSEMQTKIEPFIVYKKKKLMLSLGLPVIWIDRRTNDNHRSDVRLCPSLQVKLTPNGQWEMALNYNPSFAPYNLIQLTSIPLYTSYISMQQGTGRMGYVEGHSLGFQVSYKSPINGVFATLLATMVHTDGMPLYNSMLQNDIYVRKATDQTTTAKNITIYSRVAKSTRWARLLAALSFEYNNSCYNLLMDYGDERSKQIMPYKTQSGLLTAEVSLQPLTWFSFGQKMHWQFSKQSGADISTYFMGSLNSFTHETRACFMPGSWIAELKSEIYHSNDKSVSFSSFFDISIIFRKKEYEFGIEMNNIFGNITYERRFITNTQYVYTLSQIRQRELLLHFSFSL